MASAHKASAYLLNLVDQKAINPTPSKELDAIYRSTSPSLPPPKPDTPHTTPQDTDDEPDPRITLLLPNPAGTIPRIIEAYALPKEAERSLLRAVEQAQLRSEADEEDVGDD